MLAQLTEMLLRLVELSRAAYEANAAMSLGEIPVAMAIGPAAFIGASLGSTLLSSLLNRPSSGERQALASQNQASQAQADQLRQQTQLRAFLEQILRGGAEMPRSAAPPIFQFPEAAGGPALDPEFLSQLSPALSPEFMALMDLAGLGVGTSAISGAAGLAQRQGENRATGVQGLVNNIITALLLGGGGGGGPSGSQLTQAFTPVSSGALLPIFGGALDG